LVKVRRSNRPGQATWRSWVLFLGGRSRAIVALVVVSVCAGLCESIILALIAQVATDLATKHMVAVVHIGPINLKRPIEDFVVAGLAIAVVRIALQGALSYLPAKVCADLQARTRHNLFSVFTRASWSVQSRDGEGEFQELLTSQVIQFTWGATQGATAISSACMLVVLIATALVVQPAAALIMIGAAIALFALMRPLGTLGRRHSGELSRAQLDYAASLYEAVNLAEEAKVFGAGEAQARQVGRLVDATRDRLFTTQFLMRLVPGVYQSIMLLLLLGGLGVLAVIGVGQLASLGTVVLLLVRASSYGQQTQGSYQIVHQSLPFLERLNEAELRYRSASVSEGARTLDSVPAIDFESVSYAYEPGRPVLSSVTFRVEPGQTIGVVGPTGAGKSSLVQLLLGLREPESGQYLLNGELAASLSTSGWTRAFAYVPQDPKLLHGTVADNIRFFRTIDDGTVEHAARLAHIHEDIASWPQGYQTVIGQRSDAVSGGQRQRICLARAIAGRPFVMVLDEPTSALDPQSEFLVQETLAALKGQMTLFVVAHGFSTLSTCDEVMVVRNGHLEAFGTAVELTRSNDFYRNATTGLHFGAR
jgi:ATP-binding cassette, subfamily B, bacterial